MKQTNKGWHWGCVCVIYPAVVLRGILNFGGILKTLPGILLDTQMID